MALGSISRNEACLLLTLQSLIVRSLRVLAITERELKLIAAAALIGLSSSPNAFLIENALQSRDLWGGICEGMIANALIDRKGNEKSAMW